MHYSDHYCVLYEVYIHDSGKRKRSYHSLLCTSSESKWFHRVSPSESMVVSKLQVVDLAASFSFLSNQQRMNVAITRSKMAVYVLGHLKSLKVLQSMVLT